MDSIGTRSKSLPRTIWNAIALAGSSTITQQLVKNLFFGTGRSILRKGAEVTLVPVAEFVLGKTAHSGDIPQRGRMGALVFMVQSRRVVTYDETAARNIGRQQAARLAAILPAPPEAATRADE